MSTKKRSARGFRVFGEVSSRYGGTWKIGESSIAGVGAHVYVQTDEPCMDFPGDCTGWHVHKTQFKNHLSPSMHLSVGQAKALIAALQQFVTEAESDELTEPASAEEEGK